MQPTTTTAVTTLDQLSKVPAPAAMFGSNLTGALAANAERLRSIPLIADDSDRLALDAFLKEAKKVRTVASDKRLEITRILDAVKSAYTSAEKEQARDLDEHIAAATNEITRYLRQQLAQQQAEQQRIADEQAKVLARKRSEESKAAVQIQTEEMQAAAVVVPASGVRLVWAFEVVNPDAVPAAYFALDTDRIKQAVANGTREITGVRIYQDIARSGR